MKIIFCSLVFFNLLFANNIQITSINHHSKYEKLTRNIVEKESKDLNIIFGIDSIQIPIFLFNSHKDFRNKCGLGDHIAGVMLSSKNQIYLKTPELTASDLNDYEKLIRHELIHLYHNQKMSINLFPDWFTEGIAVYLSNDFGIPQKIKLSKRLLNKQLPSIMNLQNINLKYNNKASTEYILSASIIEFLIMSYDINIINEIFIEMSKTKNFYKALKEVTKLDMDLLNFYWKQYLKEKYSTYYLLDLQYILWLFLPFIFIFSLIVKLFQNQLIINKWKYETFEEQINRIFIDTDSTSGESFGTSTLSNQ